MVYGYDMITYPLILFEKTEGIVEFKNTKIDSVNYCTSSVCSDSIFNNFKNAATSMIEHASSKKDIRYIGTTISNNVLLTPNGMISIITPAAVV